MARALRFQARLPKLFWGECVLAAAHLINLTPTPVLHGKTPYEYLFGVAPSYDGVRVFGCLCYAANRPRVKDKFDSKSRRCIFVGYPFGKKGWRLFDLETREFFVSRDVQFFESSFPYCDVLSDATRHQWDSYLAHPGLWDDDLYGDLTVLFSTVLMFVVTMIWLRFPPLGRWLRHQPPWLGTRLPLLFVWGKSYVILLLLLYGGPFWILWLVVLMILRF